MIAALMSGAIRLTEDEALALMQGGQSIETLLAEWHAEAAQLPAAIAVVPGGKTPLRTGWHDDLARLTGARPDALADGLAAALAGGTHPAEALRTAGGLDGWAIPDPALQKEFHA